MNRIDPENRNSFVETLTRRELEVLSLLGERLSNDEVASRLQLSVYSVKWYARNIYSKLGVTNCRQAALFAQKLGLNFTNQTETEPAQPGNLPASVNSFIGRKAEVDYLGSAIENTDTRLFTLTGSGGVGKTRLAIEIARQVATLFLNGAWLVDLALVVDPDLVPQTVLSTLGLSSSTGEERAQLLSSYLKNKKILLILDNCEHLLSACAKLANGLLMTCPQLVILATSREALRIPGEIAFRVPSLSIPDPQHQPYMDNIAQYEAVRLFYERATTVRNDFALTKDNFLAVVQICRHLDGIPLAIELAAARASMLSVEQISDRLEDRFLLLTGGNRTALPRQQTLRASIDWSYSLLDKTEQKLLQGLTIFSGGWSLEAAEAIWSSDHPGKDEVLDILTSLVNKSLVLINIRMENNPRYDILELIRQYAREKLANEKLVGPDIEAIIRDRHLAYYLQFAEGKQSELMSTRRLMSLIRLETELENFRTALQWSLNDGSSAKAEQGLQLSMALVDFWERDGFLNEGRDWVERCLASLEWGTSKSITLRHKTLSAARKLTLWMKQQSTVVQS